MIIHKQLILIISNFTFYKRKQCWKLFFNYFLFLFIIIHPICTNGNYL